VVVLEPEEKKAGDEGSWSRSVAEAEELKKTADRARYLLDYGRAADDYRVLLGNWAGYSRFEGRLSFSKADVQAALRLCRIGLCGAQSRREIVLGNYARALGIYRAALGDYPGNASLKAGYGGVAAELGAAAAKAVGAGDHALAGRVNTALLEHLPSLEELGIGTGLDRTKLAAAVRDSSVHLTNRGLEEYRKGNLERAVLAWESLLVFDPGNEEVAKAVRTAKAQLGLLRNGKAGSGGAKKSP